MRKDAVILIAENDDDSFLVLERNLRRSGINHEIIRFKTGSELLGFLDSSGKGVCKRSGTAYLLMLNPELPEIGDKNILREIKSDPELKKIPIVALSSVDDTEYSDAYYELGGSVYMTKPAEHESFVETAKKIGAFLGVVEVPVIGKSEQKVSS